MSDKLERLSRALYAQFAVYTRPEKLDLCRFCHDEADVDYLRTTPLRTINGNYAQRLLWETADHWPSVEVYKHYLPRILESLAPPDPAEALYPEHLFEVLNHHKFVCWPAAEKALVLQYVEAIQNVLPAGPSAELRNAAAILRTECDVS